MPQFLTSEVIKYAPPIWHFIKCAFHDQYNVVSRIGHQDSAKKTCFSLTVPGVLAATTYWLRRCVIWAEKGVLPERPGPRSPILPSPGILTNTPFELDCSGIEEAAIQQAKSVNTSFTKDSSLPTQMPFTLACACFSFFPLLSQHSKANTSLCNPQIIQNCTPGLFSLSSSGGHGSTLLSKMHRRPMTLLTARFSHASTPWAPCTDGCRGCWETRAGSSCSCSGSWAGSTPDVLKRVDEGDSCCYWRAWLQLLEGTMSRKRKLLFWARTVASECFTCGRPLKKPLRVCVRCDLWTSCACHIVWSEGLNFN